MDDFIFGTLATEQLKRERVYGIRAGISHNFRRLPLDPLPAQPVRLILSVGPEYPVRRGWVYWTTDGSDPQGSQGRALNGFAAPLFFTHTEWDTILWGYLSYYEAVLPGFPTGSLVRYHFGFEMADGGEKLSDQGQIFGFYVDDDPLPVWTKDAVVYEIFVDRFSPGKNQPWPNPSSLSDFYGGSLRGITEQLDYLVDLGVNVLWLTPVFPSPSHHGYDATDFFEIEPRLGGKRDFKELLVEAHRRGIRVLMDFVPNHISNMHPYFQQAVSDPASPYRQWFNFRRYPDDYETFFGVTSLPKLNLRHPAARQYVLDAARYWLEFGVDGFRVDYAIGPAADFWAEFRKVTRQAKADCWTFGEIVDPSDVQLTFAGQLDGALDFILLEGLRQSLAFGRWDGVKLASFLERHHAYFPQDFSRPSFLDNHDMNRFLWAAGNDQRRLKLAALLQFSLVGPPVIYYGTEAGLSQQRDVRQNGRGIPEESRSPMLWGEEQDKDLLKFYGQLIRVRKQFAALRRGTCKVQDCNEAILVLEREFEEERLTTVINLSATRQTQWLIGHWIMQVETGSGCEVILEGQTSKVTIPALSGAILSRLQ
ncbi:glycoside hydrolase family 13 protein [Bellilinea sp.]|uniref:glycoside hydrolase family 13 protein n=1 Tax=Bellilinea sp. TaxID=2838785 RepID=UPI002ADE81ED|nr:glycoside hydrolase family 13 protein [Bellilinea sp.]